VDLILVGSALGGWEFGVTYSEFRANKKVATFKGKVIARATLIKKVRL